MKYENLPNSLAELEELKKALPEKQKRARERIKEERDSLKNLEAFKSTVSMPISPKRAKWREVIGYTLLGLLTLCAGIFATIVAIFDGSIILGALGLLVTFGGGYVLYAVFDVYVVSEGTEGEYGEAEYKLACTDFEAYKEKKAKEFADKRERELREREFKLKDEARLIDRKIREVKAEMDYRAKHKPKCPTCGSERVAPIGEAERWMDSTGLGTVVGGGLNSPSLGKSYRCFNCGYRW